MVLSKDFIVRPATMDNAEQVTDLLNTCAVEQTGKPEIKTNQLRTDWKRITFDLETDSRVILSINGKLVGYGAVWGSAPHVRTSATAVIHPKHRGQGLGVALCRWVEERARRSIPKAPQNARVTVFQEKLSTDEAAKRLLLDQGYQIVRYEHRMLIEMDAPPLEPIIPNGIVIRPFVRGKEDRALIQTTREAFKGHWGYVERPFEEEFEEWMQLLDNSENDPELWIVAVSGDEIIGTVYGYPAMVEGPELGWVYGLGVRKPWRRSGLGLALLVYCFGALYRHRKRRVGLDVDAENLSGATRLYEKAGMRVERQKAIYEKELRPGRDLSTQSLEN